MSWAWDTWPLLLPPSSHSQLRASLANDRHQASGYGGPCPPARPSPEERAAMWLPCSVTPAAALLCRLRPACGPVGPTPHPHRGGSAPPCPRGRGVAGRRGDLWRSRHAHRSRWMGQRQEGPCRGGHSAPQRPAPSMAVVWRFVLAWLCLLRKVNVFSSSFNDQRKIGFCRKRGNGQLFCFKMHPGPAEEKHPQLVSGESGRTHPSLRLRLVQTSSGRHHRSSAMLQRHNEARTQNGCRERDTAAPCHPQQKEKATGRDCKPRSCLSPTPASMANQGPPVTQFLLSL